ncbi:hypothetical protein ARMSODRAFT_381743 [Armillaria solidipes]|uniref:Uncharacterized protein n=1 Tax=Armillaria solidipes TaxID=1076256 RepID=A0A2H3BMZ4_9AGAR|nr:hypothetical protein ARMSODRAFT_381743 [Armillaria solidipes]
MTAGPYAIFIRQDGVFDYRSRFNRNRQTLQKKRRPVSPQSVLSRGPLFAALPCWIPISLRILRFSCYNPLCAFAILCVMSYVGIIPITCAHAIIFNYSAQEIHSCYLTGARHGSFASTDSCRRNETCGHNICLFRCANKPQQCGVMIIDDSTTGGYTPCHAQIRPNQVIEVAQDVLYPGHCHIRHDQYERHTVYLHYLSEGGCGRKCASSRRRTVSICTPTLITVLSPVLRSSFVDISGTDQRLSDPKPMKTHASQDSSLSKGPKASYID